MHSGKPSQKRRSQWPGWARTFRVMIRSTRLKTTQTRNDIRRSAALHSILPLPIHPHVKRPILAEGKSSFRLVHLHGRAASVQEDGVDAARLHLQIQQQDVQLAETAEQWLHATPGGRISRGRVRTHLHWFHQFYNFNTGVCSLERGHQLLISRGNHILGSLVFALTVCYRVWFFFLLSGDSSWKCQCESLPRETFLNPRRREGEQAKVGDRTLYLSRFMSPSWHNNRDPSVHVHGARSVALAEGAA